MTNISKLFFLYLIHKGCSKKSVGCRILNILSCYAFIFISKFTLYLSNFKVTDNGSVKTINTGANGIFVSLRKKNSSKLLNQWDVVS